LSPPPPDTTINAKERTVDFTFHLASSHGTASVLLSIGLEDCKLLLKDIAQTMPKTMSDTLCECVALATNKILAQLARPARC
jgi:hypothetical protein